MLTYTAFLHLYPHPRRSMQTSASVDADICAGRCRHPRRSMQTSASVDAQPPKTYNNTIVRQT